MSQRTLLALILIATGIPALRAEEPAKRVKVFILAGPAADAAQKLQSALDKFKDARPDELDKQFRDSVKKN